MDDEVFRRRRSTGRMRPRTHVVVELVLWLLEVTVELLACVFAAL